MPPEVDEQWSYVGNKKCQRWLWHAIDYVSGKVLAYVVGRWQDEAILRLQKLLSPFGITKYDTDIEPLIVAILKLKSILPGKVVRKKL